MKPPCLSLAGPTRKPRHASVFSTHSDTQPVPAFHCIRLFKNLLMPLFLMGCFPVDFQEGKRPLRTKSGKRPIKVGKRPINEGKRPIKAKVLVGVSVGCLGCFRAPPPWRKTAPLKRPIKRSMNCIRLCLKTFFRHARVFKMHRHAVYQCLKKPSPYFFDTLAFLKRAFRHACVRF